MTVQTCYDLHIQIVEIPRHLELPSSAAADFNNINLNFDDFEYNNDHDDDEQQSCCSNITDYSDDSSTQSLTDKLLNMAAAGAAYTEEGNDESDSSEEEDDDSVFLLASKSDRERVSRLRRELDNDSVGMARRRGIPRWGSITNANDAHDDNDNNEVPRSVEDYNDRDGFIYGYEMESYDIPLKGCEDDEDEEHYYYNDGGDNCEEQNTVATSDVDSASDDDDDDASEFYEQEYTLPLKSSNTTRSSSRLNRNPRRANI